MPKAILSDTIVEWFAANGSKIHAVGTMEFRLKVNDLKRSADIAVRDCMNPFLYVLLLLNTAAIGILRLVRLILMGVPQFNSNPSRTGL